MEEVFNDYEQVNHPSHYNSYDIEVIEMMKRIWGEEAVMLWARMTAYKYRMRMGLKPENSIAQDLEKEKWYLNYAKKIEKEVETKKIQVPVEKKLNPSNLIYD